MTDGMDVNSREAALWSETMSLKSRNEWLEAEIKRLQAADKSRVVVHEAEIRRLGIAMGAQADEVALMRGYWLDAENRLKEKDAEIERLSAENEYLRSCLEPMGDEVRQP